MVYPNDKETFRVVDTNNILQKGDQNNMGGCVERIEDTLGLNPEGGFADVVTRLNALLPKANIVYYQDNFNHEFNGAPDTHVFRSVNVLSTPNIFIGSLVGHATSRSTILILCQTRLYLQSVTSYCGNFYHQVSAQDEQFGIACNMSYFNVPVGSQPLGVWMQTANRDVDLDDASSWLIGIYF